MLARAQISGRMDTLWPTVGTRIRIPDPWGSVNPDDIQYTRGRVCNIDER